MSTHFDIIGSHGGGGGRGRGGGGGRGRGGGRGGRAIRTVSLRSFGPGFRTFGTSLWRYPWWGYYPQFFYPSQFVYQQPAARQLQTSLLTVCEAWQHAEQLGDTLLAQQLRERCEDVLENLSGAGVDVRMAPLAQIGQDAGGAGGVLPSAAAWERYEREARRETNPAVVNALYQQYAEAKRAEGGAGPTGPYGQPAPTGTRGARPGAPPRGQITRTLGPSRFTEQAYDPATGRFRFIDPNAPPPGVLLPRGY